MSMEGVPAGGLNFIALGGGVAPLLGSTSDAAFNG